MGDGMVRISIRDEIISRLDELTVEQLEEVLGLVRAISVSRLPPAKPVENFLKYAGCISKEDLAAMAEATEDCEQIDLEEWEKPIFPE